jgi:N-acetylglucosaminyldiphosphoundecaprenol N-acetyl-beta-D-mannosaminyltransferase
LATEPGTLRFANLTFRGLQRKTLLRDDGRFKAIITVNAEIIVEAHRNPKLAEIINSNWATLDGQWPYLLARWRSGVRELEKISGSDFVYELCEFAAQHGHRLFLLGAAAEVNRTACERLRSDFGIEIDGYSPPNMPFPFPEVQDEEMLARLEKFRPKIVVVCFGSPKQELWADLHKQALDGMGVRWVIGAGGTLDFVAGTVKRAPVLFQKAGLESLWRLALEPRSRIRRVLRAFHFLRYA